MSKNVKTTLAEKMEERKQLTMHTIFLKELVKNSTVVHIILLAKFCGEMHCIISTHCIRLYLK